MGKMMNALDFSIERDSKGLFLTIKSDLIEEEAKKYSSGLDSDGSYSIRGISNYRNFIFNFCTGGVGSDEISRALRKPGLREGIKIKLSRPMSLETAKDLCKSLDEALKLHIKEHIGAYRVRVRLDIDESYIRWEEGTENG